MCYKTILRAKLLKKNGTSAHCGDYFTYFCIVKQIISSFKIVLLSTALTMIGLCPTQAENSRMDSVTISLLTVGAGNEVWSLYGHTAIRYQDHTTGEDLAINYGAFSFDQPFFVPRFVFGLTDYEMAIYPMDLFMQVYREERRWVLQQTLNLTTEEKQRIAKALYENYLPQNRIYRYNYFYDNCTTRARNLIINNLNTKEYKSDIQWNGESYRTMVHQWAAADPWTRFGNDLLLGISADFHTNREASFFLPDSVRKDFDHTILTDRDGSKRPMVSRKTWLISPKEAQATPPPTPLTPLTAMAALLAVTLTLSIVERRRGRIFWGLDLLLLFLTGTAGVMLFAMIFSQHPTVRVNLQILLLNPLSLLLLYPTLKAERRGLTHRYWKVLTICILFFFIGAFFQHYAEGMLFLALSLLVRCWCNLSRHRVKA